MLIKLRITKLKQN